MRKQLTVLGLFVILTGLSLTNANAQVRVGVVIAPRVCSPPVVCQPVPTRYCNRPAYYGPNHGHGHHNKHWKNNGHHNGHGNHHGHNNGHGNHYGHGNNYGRNRGNCN